MKEKKKDFSNIKRTMILFSKGDRHNILLKKKKKKKRERKERERKRKKKKKKKKNL